jgi:NADP-dependent 3-hydroxy acid dehydrogenase YdfG
MRRELAGSVIVIVGASSGVGRATALAFAEHHAKLVLTARNEHDLATLV